MIFKEPHVFCQKLFALFVLPKVLVLLGSIDYFIEAIFICIVFAMLKSISQLYMAIYRLRFCFQIS